MKKLSLALGSLLLVSGVAYGKEVAVAPVEVVTETVYVAAVAPSPVTNVYGRVGLDLWSEYDNSSIVAAQVSDGDTDGIGFEVALEVTRNITDRLELGLGIAYQRHADLNSYNWNLGELTDGYIDKVGVDVDRYDSVPLYVVGKYNFEPFDNGLKPYLKANVGFSFNFDKGDTGIKVTGSGGRLDRSYKLGMDVENGFYMGIGGGFEYNDFFVDLMYQVNTAEAEFDANSELGNIGVSGINTLAETDMDYSRVTLGFGYKFTY